MQPAANTRTVHDEFNALIAFQVEAARMATLRALEAEQRLEKAMQQIAALKAELGGKDEKIKSLEAAPAEAPAA